VILGCIVNKMNTAKKYGYQSYYKYYQAGDYQQDAVESGKLLS
jgi:hypothetical protein